MKLPKLIRRPSKTAVVSFAVTATAVIASLDYYTGPELGFSIFYLAPVYLVSRYLGPYFGTAAAFASAMGWLVVNLAEGGYSSPVAPYWNAFVRFCFFGVVVALQYSLVNAENKSRRDPLTKIGNRRYFFDHLGFEITRHTRYGHPFTVAYMDVDGFKAINDTLGHKAGDRLLKLVAATIKARARETDILARLGGDEFAIFLTETQADDARGMLEDLRQRLLEEVGRHGWPVTFSIGAKTFLSPIEPVEEIISSVDELMYAAKRDGKDRIVFHGPEGVVGLSAPAFGLSRLDRDNVGQQP